jgi:hypothetical protein
MITFLLISALSINGLDLSQVRKLFTIASTDEKANTKLFELTSGYTLDYKPVIYAYNAAAEMTKANHSNWPISKLQYFNAGKSRLENAVKKYPNLLEIRYVRYAVQNGSPSFLGYKGDMLTDKQKIKKELTAQDWPSDFKETVTALINL